MIVELPNYFLVARHFQHLRLCADMTVTQVIAKNRIAIGQSLAAGHESQRVTGQIILVQLPYDLSPGIEFNDLVPVTAGDEQVALGQRHDFVRIPGNLDFAEHLAGAVDLICRAVASRLELRSTGVPESSGA